MTRQILTIPFTVEQALIVHVKRNTDNTSEWTHEIVRALIQYRRETEKQLIQVCKRTAKWV